MYRVSFFMLAKFKDMNEKTKLKKIKKLLKICKNKMPIKNLNKQLFFLEIVD